MAAVPIHTAHAASPVFISEIAWAGSSLSTADEWIEIGNASDEPLDLGNWRLVGAGDGGQDIVLPTDAILPAHGVYVISNYAETDARCSLDVVPDMVTTMVALSNSTQLVTLLDADANFIDQAGDGGTPLAGFSSTAAKSTMERLDPTISGAVQEAWQSAETNLGLRTQDLGTPGSLNAAITPAETQDQNEANEPIILNEDKPETEVIDAQESTSTTTMLTTIASDSATSTEAESPLPTDTVPTTSTQSTVMEVISNIETTSTVASTDPAGVTTVLTTPDRSMLRLNEVMPDPSDGPEWVEIINSQPDRTISLDGLHLEDNLGSVAVLHGWLTPTQTHIVITLSSARFNNGGDIVRLVASDGTVIDSLTYAESHDGAAWARDAHGAWRETTTPTSGAVNIVTEIPIIATQSPAIVAPEVPTQPAAVAVPKTTTTKKAPTKPSSTASTTKTAVKTKSDTKSVALKATSTKNIAAKKPTAVKSTAKTSSTPAPTLMTIDMLNTLDQGNIRVLLYGTVGTQPNLMTGRSFVLLNPQGRGLLVRVGSDKKLPPMGAPVRVTGMLKFDSNELPYLSFNKDDGWYQLTEDDAGRVGAGAIPQPRSIAWFAPSTEDAWSLAQASGTVVSVSGQTVTIATDDGDLDIKIRPVTGYRAARLKNGDRIAVTGILLLGNERPALYPRIADEIILIAHANPPEIAPVISSSTATGLPGWTPFGAAAIAVGAVQGAKIIRKNKFRAKEKTPRACGVA